MPFFMPFSRKGVIFDIIVFHQRQRDHIEALVSIANALHVSVDDLLVDSLDYPISTADSELHRLLLDCNKIEEEILTKNAQELKKIMYRLGI